MIESQKFRVWNTTRDSLLCAEITVADAGHEELDQLIESIVTRPGAGLWLQPCIGAPVAESAPPFDLICIDRERRVVEQYESFCSGMFVLFQPRTTSALIFPARTVATSKTEVGDLLDIMLPEASLASPMPVEDVKHEMAPKVESAIEQEKKESPVREPVTATPVTGDGGWESNSIPSTPAANAKEADSKKKDSLSVRFLRWLVPDRRKDERRASPILTAHRWSGDQVHTYQVEDVSSAGLYLVTDERPLRGTVFMLTLKKKSSHAGGDEDSIAVQSKVARWGENGLGLEFMTSDGLTSEAAKTSMEGGASSIQLRRFLQDV